MFSPVRWGVVPLPGEANAIFLPLDSLMCSGSVRAGMLAFTKIMFGCDAGIATAMKSRSASYPGLGYRLAFTAIADEVMSTV